MMSISAEITFTSNTTITLIYKDDIDTLAAWVAEPTVAVELSNQPVWLRKSRVKHIEITGDESDLDEFYSTATGG